MKPSLIPTSSERTILLPSSDGYYFLAEDSEQVELFIGKAFKKLAKNITTKIAEKKIEKSGLPEETKADLKEKVGEAIELTTETFRQNMNASAKATLAFIMGMAGGPVGAFTAAIGVSVKESEKIKADFISRAAAAGIPVTVDGQPYVPYDESEWTVTENYSTDENIGTQKKIIIGVACLVVLLILLLLL